MNGQALQTKGKTTVIDFDLCVPRCCARTTSRYAAGLLLLCLIGAGTAPAFGHTRLLESAPADGQHLADDAGVLTLIYSEPIQPRFSDFALHYLGEVQDTTATPGNRLPRESVRVDDVRRHVEVLLPDDLPAGWYALDWAVLADDGHRIDGTLRFQIAR